MSGEHLAAPGARRVAIDTDPDELALPNPGPREQSLWRGIGLDCRATLAMTGFVANIVAERPIDEGECDCGEFPGD